MKRFCSVFILLLFIQCVNAQTVVYTILSKDDKPLGSLKATNSSHQDHEFIQVESRITIKKLLKIVVSYNLKSSFKEGKLYSNKVTTYLNDKVRDEMSTRQTSSGYQFTKNDNVKQVRDFSFSESMMYYNEPKGVSKIYSEFDGVFKSVVYRKDEKCYELTNPDNNNVSQYYYQNGVLQKAVVKSTFVTLYLYLKAEY